MRSVGAASAGARRCAASGLRLIGDGEPRHLLGQASSAARIRSWNSVSEMRAASAGLSLMVPLPEASSG